MTQVVQAIQADALERLVGCRLVVKWPCLLPPPSREEGEAVFRNGQARMASFEISLEVLGEGRGRMSSWVDRRGASRLLMEEQSVQLEIHEEGGLRQIRVTNEGEFVLLLVLDGEDGLAYVQTPLLEEGGFPGGRYDPPTLRVISKDG